MTPQSFRRAPLSHIFGSPMNVRVLRELFAQGGPLSAAQIVPLAQLSYRGVRIALDGLVAAGLVVGLGRKGTQMFQLVPTHPLATPLKELFAQERAWWENTLSNLRKELAGQPSVRAAWMYGSVARGDDGPDSDTDLAVLAASADSETMQAARDAIGEVAEMLQLNASIIVISPTELGTGAIDPAWFENVAKDAKTLKGRDPLREKVRCMEELETNEH